jgi:hypothetical protein
MQDNVQNLRKQEPSGLKWYMTNILFPETTYYFTLFMVVIGCSENYLYVYQITLRHITEHKSLYIKDTF